MNYGIKFEPQFNVGMYFWDFFLPEHNLLIDVNGEYWHALKENVSKDKSKFTYTKRYTPQYGILYIHEKSFLNPEMAKNEILKKINKDTGIVQQFDFEFSQVKVRKITDKSYTDFLKSYHYSREGRYGKSIYGAYIDEQLVAICKFNGVVRKEVASSMHLKCTEVLELDRFCIHPNYQKKNFASWFISRCVDSVFSEFSGVKRLVSFADSTYKHSGTIYKASNWIMIGETKPSYHYMSEDGFVVNKKVLYSIASKFKMKETEYANKHNFVKYREEPKLKFVFDRKD